MLATVQLSFHTRVIENSAATRHSAELRFDGLRHRASSNAALEQLGAAHS